MWQRYPNRINPLAVGANQVSIPLPIPLADAVTWQGGAGFLPGDWKPVAFQSQSDLVQYWAMQYSDDPYEATTFAFSNVPTTTAIVLLNTLTLPGESNGVLYMSPSLAAAWCGPYLQQLGVTGFSKPGPVIPTYAAVEQGVQYIAIAGHETVPNYASCVLSMNPNLAQLYVLTM
jgi:hypothetical protein